MITAQIMKYDTGRLLLQTDRRISDEIANKKIKRVDIILHDGRYINHEQRKKIYAIIKDISDYNGDLPEYLKEFLKLCFLEKEGGDYFSLSDCSCTVASDFINYLINFCFEHNIPTSDTMLNRTDDISRYLYSCIANRKCCICNDKAEIHHCEGSRVGMGFNRRKIDNVGRRAIALCRKHHAQAHTSESDFFEKYHVYGIELDEYLIKKTGL